MAFSVLIVDDSPAMRAFIRRVIDMSGFDVGNCIEAGDGEEAMTVLSQNWVDVVLTDINMPRMNGEELVRCMHNDELLKAIPVVVVSTDSTEARMSALMELGAQGYVTKPFHPEQLRVELERVLEIQHA
jgi:two-component system, chemotaxis family, chemotaxis protein CheY